MTAHHLPLHVAAALLLATACLLCAADTLIDASLSIHPISISVQLPSSSQLVFYSISLATALAPGESAAAAASRSSAHSALSAPVVLCSSTSVSANGDASNSSDAASAAAASTCVFGSNLTAQLEDLLLRSPAPSTLLLQPPSFTACVRAFSAIGNFSFDAQRCSSISCATELQSFQSSYNLSAASTDVCEPLAISLPPLVLAASFGSQTIVMSSLVPTGSTTPLLNATFTAAASAAGADLKLLLLVSSLASNFSIAPINQPAPPCRSFSSVAFASHTNINVTNASSWMLPSFQSPRASAVPYRATSPLASLLLSSPAVALLAVVTLTIKPCLFVPAYNQPFCIVPSTSQPAAPASAPRDARFNYAFTQQSDQSRMTVSTPIICAAYTLPLPQPRWLSVAVDGLSRAQPVVSAVFAPALFPTALQKRAASAVVAAAAADVVAFRARLECSVWQALMQSSAATAHTSTIDLPCPVTPPSMPPALHLIYTAAECRVAIPFNATSGTSGFNVSLSFLPSPSTKRFTFRTFTGAAADSDAAQFSAEGERVEVQAEAAFASRDVGTVVPLCAVIWTAAASPAANASAFNTSLTRMHCVLLLVQPCTVCARRSIAYTAATMFPPASPKLLMALNLNTVRAVAPPPPGFSVSPPALSPPQRAWLLLPELQRTQAFNMPEGLLLQTGIAHTIVKGESLASIVGVLRGTLPMLAAANPGLPMNATEAGAGGGDYELIEGAMLCVQPRSSSSSDGGV